MGRIIKSIFGTNLKYYRKQKHLSQEQLSEKLNISPKHLGTIERGITFISANLLEKMTRILDVSASALFYTPEEKSGDNGLLTLVDKIVEQELLKAAGSIKAHIRQGKYTELGC
jgi:transcriptional regulator with XRE-family HTH domain